MKKQVTLAAFVAVAAASTFAYAGLGARTGVNGSLHDMNFYTQNAALQGDHTGTGTVDRYNRVCVFCHTPHNAIVNDEGSSTNFLPLWGRALGSTADANPYVWATPANAGMVNPDGTTFSAGIAMDPLVGPSRLCMSCHDGSVAVDAHISNGADLGRNLKLTGTRAIGSNDSTLAKTHPIGFSYIEAKNKRNIAADPLKAGSLKVDEVVDESEGFATAIINNDAQGTYNDVKRNGNRTIKSVLYNGDIMTCASCHEVHNKENATQAASQTGATTPNYFLYAQEKESLICLSCHVK